MTIEKHRRVSTDGAARFSLSVAQRLEREKFLRQRLSALRLVGKFHPIFRQLNEHRSLLVVRCRNEMQAFGRQ
jgi:hypothetical protein